MEVRRLRFEDSSDVMHRGRQLAATLYPELIEDIEKFHALLTDTRNDEKHYAYVVGEAGAPRAALIARTGANLWATRRHAAVLLWYSDIPGAGAKLLRHFRSWAMQQKSLAIAGMTIDCELDPRIPVLLERTKFRQIGHGTYVLYPRGAKR